MEEKVYLHALSYSGLLPGKVIPLIRFFETAKSLWETDAKNLEEKLSFKEKQKFLNFRETFQVSREWEKFQRSGYKLLAFTEASYPKLLKEITDPPLVLYWQGDHKPGDEPALAIVGSRNASPYGKLQAKQLAGALSQVGITIISGLARGIDMAAHQGALEGGGKTLAILGSGLDQIYPPENKNLANRILLQGSIASEFPPETPPFAWNFPRRNRVISGLSLGVIVVEAREKSGALITARFALEDGREVFALPGLSGSDTSKGSNKLIQAGAKLVQEVKDVLEEFPYLSFSKTESNEKEEDTIETKILASLRDQKRGKSIELLIKEIKLPIEQLTGKLFVLETKGLISRLPGNIYTKI